MPTDSARSALRSQHRPAPLGPAASPLLSPHPGWTAFMASWCTPRQAQPLVGTRAGGEVVAHHGSWVLYSVFQPIFAANDSGKPVAFEALIRAHDMHSGHEVPLAELFQHPVDRDDGVLLDRLCRLLHVLNFHRQSPQGAALYLNLDAGYLQSLQPGLHGQFFTALQAEVAYDPARIILEITETEIESREVLAGIVESFKRRGFRVAIDDFGARHSNFDRLWSLTPDIVKIDRELLLQAEVNPRAGKIFPKLIDIIHDLGAQVVCEGIETADQQALATQCQADFLQGYRFARPLRTLQW